MSKQYLIGIDLGSSFAKTSLFDSAGQALGDVSCDNHPSQPRPGVAEYDGPQMLAATVRALRGLMEHHGIAPGDVAAICTDGMISGTLGIDAAGEATTPYTTTLDIRFAPELNHVMDHYHDPIRRLTGAGQPCFAPKMLWIHREFPEAYARTAKFVTIASYVAGKLAGLPGNDNFIDYTYLWATGLSDTVNYAWSEELCQAMDLPVDKLPRIVKSTDIIGAISAEIARATGLRQGTPIVAGCGDQSACFVAAGITAPGRMADGAGTYPVLAFCTDSFRPDLAGRRTEILPSPVPGLWNPMTLIIGGGLTHHWFQEQFAAGDALEATQRGDGSSVYSILDEKAARVGPGSQKVFFIPHMAGRACPTNTDYRGMWVGFSWAHRREHFYRAVLESIAYDQYHALESLRVAYPEVAVNEIYVYSGGARSALWNQIKADVMDLPYLALDREDLGALGAAILAGYAVGIYDDLATVGQRFVKATRRYEPQPAVHELYRQYAEFYGRLLRYSEPAYRDLAALPDWQG
jgi:xylulokinase